MNANRDENRVPTLLALDADNNIVPVQVNPVTGRILADGTENASVAGPVIDYATRDENYVPVGLAIQGSGCAPIQVDINDRIICSLN